jgi:hypothetical protein
MAATTTIGLINLFGFFFFSFNVIHGFNTSTAVINRSVLSIAEAFTKATDDEPSKVFIKRLLELTGS